MEAKKISFGFMKTKKPEKQAAIEKREYIECVEEQSIKVIGGEAAKEEKPLVIPLKPNTLITAEKLREIAEKAENFDDVKIKTEEETKVNLIPENETLEQMAARELLEEAKKDVLVETAKLVVPVNTQPVLEGHTESTLDDYESVPVQEFGLAMLRGMGWTQGKESTYKQPQLRPKGLGLGADKVITDKKKNSKDKDKEEELPLIKNSFIKVTTGKHLGYYGKVVSLDEDNGRVVVELTIKKETVSLSEFMVQVVPKSVFDKESKVINTESYEEYKRKENVQKTTTDNYKEKSTSSRNKYEEIRKNETERHSNGKRRSRSRENRRRKDSYSSEEDRGRHRKKEKKKYSSNESIDSSESDRQKSSSRRRYSSDSSSSDDRRKYKSKSKNSKEKRDIDKKRKGKKKKRDRDRSPNYRRHRK